MSIDTEKSNGWSFDQLSFISLQHDLKAIDLGDIQVLRQCRGGWVGQKIAIFADL